MKLVTLGRLRFGKNFDVNVGEGCSATWVLGTNSAFTPGKPWKILADFATVHLAETKTHRRSHIYLQMRYQYQTET
jgi:hypothetical protein